MAKKKHEKSPSSEGGAVRERIAIVMKNFRHLVQAGPSAHHRFIKGYGAAQIIFDEKLIDELLEMDSPIRVYYRDVD